MKPFIMSDRSLKKLTRKIEEKLGSGFEMLTKVRSETHDLSGITKWEVTMQKISKEV